MTYEGTGGQGMTVSTEEMLAVALRRSVLLIDDWLNTFAPEYCDELRVHEAFRRINEFGTVGYIAEVQQQNRAALSRIDGERK